MGLWLNPIPACLRAPAAAALEAGDVLGFLAKADNTRSLDLVAYNLVALQARGLYEQALLHAFVATRVNNRRWPLPVLRGLFECADLARLRAAGDSLPGPGPFMLYRGVAGRGRARRVRGLSWTADLDRAWWFARWFSTHLPGQFSDPAVFRVTVDAQQVLAVVNSEERGGRGEQEFIVLLPASLRPVRVESPIEKGA